MLRTPLNRWILPGLLAALGTLAQAETFLRVENPTPGAWTLVFAEGAPPATLFKGNLLAGKGPQDSDAGAAFTPLKGERLVLPAWSFLELEWDDLAHPSGRLPLALVDEKGCNPHGTHLMIRWERDEILTLPPMTQVVRFTTQTPAAGNPLAPSKTWAVTTKPTENSFIIQYGNYELAAGAAVAAREAAGAGSGSGVGSGSAQDTGQKRSGTAQADAGAAGRKRSASPHKSGVEPGAKRARVSAPGAGAKVGAEASAGAAGDKPAGSRARPRAFQHLTIKNVSGAAWSLSAAIKTPVPVLLTRAGKTSQSQWTPEKAFEIADGTEAIFDLFSLGNRSEQVKASGKGQRTQWIAKPFGLSRLTAGRALGAGFTLQSVRKNLNLDKAMGPKALLKFVLKVDLTETSKALPWLALDAEGDRLTLLPDAPQAVGGFGAGAGSGAMAPVPAFALAGAGAGSGSGPASLPAGARFQGDGAGAAAPPALPLGPAPLIIRNDSDWDWSFACAELKQGVRIEWSGLAKDNGWQATDLEQGKVADQTLPPHTTATFLPADGSTWSPLAFTLADPNVTAFLEAQPTGFSWGVPETAGSAALEPDLQCTAAWPYGLVKEGTRTLVIQDDLSLGLGLTKFKGSEAGKLLPGLEDLGF